MAISTVINVTPTVDTAIYANGDILFDTVEIPLAARVASGGVVLDSVLILDEDDEAITSYSLFFFDANVSLGTINNAISISDANVRNLVGFLTLTNAAHLVDTINSRAYYLANLGMRMKADSTKSLWVGGTVVGTPTYTAATDIKLRLAFRQY